MFKRLFKRNTESTINTKEVVIPCACDRENEHCDLILKLREKQLLRKDIENKIDALNRDGNELLFNKTLENEGFIMDKDTYKSIAYNERSAYILKYVIDKCSSADIFRITEELRTYRNKADIISEKQRALKAVEDDIKNIKSKLGIE